MHFCTLSRKICGVGPYRELENGCKNINPIGTNPATENKQICERNRNVTALVLLSLIKVHTLLHKEDTSGSTHGHFKAIK